jgi:hypothetical protein
MGCIAAHSGVRGLMRHGPGQGRRDAEATLSSLPGPLVDQGCYLSWSGDLHAAVRQRVVVDEDGDGGQVRQDLVQTLGIPCLR